MILLIFGPPGAGKGTQAKKLAAKFQIPHLATGDMFRANIAQQTELGKEAKAYMDRGELVPDEVTVGMLGARIKEPDCANGFILDGFPRTVAQAEALDKMLKNDNLAPTCVLALDVPDEVVVKRQAGRRIAPQSGRVYHTEFDPPQVAGKCDETGEELIHRTDDQPEVVRERLKVYRAQTEPVRGYYTQQGLVRTVDGTQPMATVFDQLLHEIEQVKV